VNDTAIEHDLIAAQADVAAAREARLKRQEVVMRARGAGWSKYRIAATLGVQAPTVDSIIRAAMPGAITEEDTTT